MILKFSPTAIVSVLREWTDWLQVFLAVSVQLENRDS